MENILLVFGGLAMFIYGINTMSEGLKKTTGEKLKTLIEKLTSNRLLGILVGAVVTMITQSSTATIVMVIGFINAGVMTLAGAAGVILGANIGTTATAQLMAFNLTSAALVSLIAGVLIYLVSLNRPIKSFADILIGFGLLFVGMDIMSKGVEPFTSSPVLASMISDLSNPYLGLILGFLITMVLQSSTASISLLQVFASQGLINLQMAFPILFGNNIGSSTTTMIASIGSNKNAKRAGLFNFIFNLIGAMIFLFILRVPVQNLVVKLSSGDVQRQIANAHTIYNIIIVLLLYPLVNFLVNTTKKIIPDKAEDKEKSIFDFIDPEKEETPAIALEQTLKEVVRMTQLVEDNLNKSSLIFKKKEIKLVDDIYATEDRIDKLELGISTYLLNLSNQKLNKKEQYTLNSLMKVISDVERIGDNAENIARMSEKAIYNNLEFSNEALEEFDNLFDKIIISLNTTIEAFNELDLKKAKRTIKIEKEIGNMHKEYKNNNVYRLNTNLCDPASGRVFLDIISDLDSIADKCAKISDYVIEYHDSNKSKKTNILSKFIK